MIQQTKELIRVNDPLDLEKVIPEPISELSNYYYFPEDRRLAVSRCGSVMNIKTGKILKGTIDDRNVKSIFISSPLQKTKSYRVYRILARTFIGRPSRHLDKAFSDLDVNHIDGDRLNFSLSNLEWVTGKENIIHSHKSGFNTKDLPVLAKCVKTNKIIRFPSIRTSADYFNIRPITLWKHLTKGKIGKRHKDWHIFKFDDGTPWKEINPKHLVRLGSEIYKYFFYVTDKLTKKIIIFDNYYDTAKFLGISISRLFRRLAKEGLYENERFKCSKKNMH